MMRKQRGRVTTGAETAAIEAKGPCAICGLGDARALVGVQLPAGEIVTLCGSHELMHRRDGARSSTLAELRVAFANRRGTERRGGPGELDELAEALTAAFTRERRAAPRRAS
jgi:hypothetical protein